jgi:hypothetical protein
MKSIFSRITHHASRITHHASRITHHASRNFKLMMCIFSLFMFSYEVISQPCRVKFSNYNDFTTATVRVNFHFLPVNPTIGTNFTQSEAETIAVAIFELANDHLTNYFMPSNLPTSVANVPDPKIRFELYSEGMERSVHVYPGPID